MEIELFKWKGFRIPKIIYRLLGREQSYGQFSKDKNLVEIDSRLRGKKLFEITHHESLHAYDYNMTEEEVRKMSRFITEIFWREGWRKVDNHEK